MPAVRIRNISKTYGPVRAVEDFSVDIQDGELLTILGPSGCGKSTLLSCIAGISRPDRGEIYLGERCLCSIHRSLFVPPQHRMIGFVFQQYALWPHMTAEKNIAYPLKIRRAGGALIKAETGRILHLLRLRDKSERYPRQLSGGEQQRVALGRALIMKPDLLILDEPLSNLDARLRAEMQEEIVRLRRDLKLTILYVTHDQSEALTMSNRVLLMNRGKAVQEGSPDELYDRPNCAFSADFLGFNNLIPMRSGVGFTWRYTAGLSAGDAEQAILSVRPEDIVLYPLNGVQPTCDGKARVDDRVFKGAFLQYTIEYEGLTLRVQTPKHIAFKIGDEVFFSVQKGLVLRS